MAVTAGAADARGHEQVKVRGFRIELGEVEAALKQAQGVRDAIVLAREDARDPLHADKRLVAYVVPAGDMAASLAQAERSVVLDWGQGAALSGLAPVAAGPDPAALRNMLLSETRAKLPEFMVPSTFVFLDAWPLTSTGKVDRRALPAPEIGFTPGGAAPNDSDGYVAPRTDQERILARIWAEVLHQERVGIHDNFFELGGDSILSIQVIARAGQAGLSLTPRQLFQDPTIAGLAALAGARAKPAEGAEQGLVQGAVPLTPIQRWFFEQDFAAAHHWNQAVLLRAPDRLDRDILSRAMAALLQHHDALRLRFRRDEQGWTQWNDAAADNVSLAYADLSALPLAEQDASLERQASEVQAGLDLAQGPLFRMAYWRLGAERGGRLLLVAHHLVMDGVSWRIVLEDLLSAYAQLRNNQEVRLPAKTTSFREWARRLVAYARSDSAAREADYWRGVTAREAPVMPVDRDGENTERSARSVAANLSAEETQALLREAVAPHREINALLLAALQQAFASWMGERPLLIGLEGHGREDILGRAGAPDGSPGAAVDITRTVGWFTTLYPVYLAPVGAGYIPQALAEVEEQLRRIPSHGIGYGLLRYLSEDAALRRDLWAEEPAVSFNYLGQFDQLVANEPAGFSLASEAIGPSHSPLARRTPLIEVSGMVVENRLRMEWTYSENIYATRDHRGLGPGYLQALRQLIVYCIAPDARPEQIAYVDDDVSRTDVDAILAELNQTTGED